MDFLENISNEIKKSNKPDCPNLTCLTRGDYARCYFEIYKDCSTFRLNERIKIGDNVPIYMGKNNE